MHTQCHCAPQMQTHSVTVLHRCRHTVSLRSTNADTQCHCAPQKQTHSVNALHKRRHTMSLRSTNADTQCHCAPQKQTHSVTALHKCRHTVSLRSTNVQYSLDVQEIKFSGYRTWMIAHFNTPIWPFVIVSDESGLMCEAEELLPYSAAIVQITLSSVVSTIALALYGMRHFYANLRFLWLQRC